MGTQRSWRFAVRRVLTIPLLILTACGTVGSRPTGRQSEDTGRFFGWPPYAAVPVDCDLVWNGDASCKAMGFERLFGLLSLPIDLVIDTAILPIDLYCSAFGYDKRARTR